jgi:hypothetical protein
MPWKLPCYILLFHYGYNTNTNLYAAKFMEIHKDKLKPQPYDLNWKDIRSDKLVKFLISMGATQMFKPHSNFKGETKFRPLLSVCIINGWL